MGASYRNVYISTHYYEWMKIRQKQEFIGYLSTHIVDKPKENFRAFLDNVYKSIAWHACTPNGQFPPAAAMVAAAERYFSQSKLWSPSTDQPNQDHDNGDHNKNVDEATYRIRRDQA